MSAVALQSQPQTLRSVSPHSARAAFLELLFAKLDAAEIAYVVLHSYDALPQEIGGSDIDFAVSEGELALVPAVIALAARAAGWLIVQRLEHELFASYTLLVNPDEPEDFVALDVCSHFTRDGALLIHDTVLLKNRHRHPRGFFVPAAAAEFIYLLIKSVAKDGGPGRHVARLRHLAAEDASGAQRNFSVVFGASGSIDNWLAASPNDWSALASKMHARHRFPSSLRRKEWSRRLSRALRPAGFHLALLGPDGSGKSTLLRNIQKSLAPCFSRQRVFRFRPDLLHQIEEATQPTPHQREPRSRLLSIAKVLYYFGDWWVGALVRLSRERRRGTLIIFDRDFNDLAVDQRRYLVQGVGGLANLLRRFAPRADATFILDGDPLAIHARKPELPIEELERQRSAFRKLAAGDARMRLVSADQPAPAVAQEVTDAVLHALAQRELRRAVPVTKRACDIVLASLALVLLSPLLAVIALIVRLKFSAPIFFTQERPGLGAKPFLIRKFRTMPDVRDASGRLLPDAQRLTRFGKLLRSTSLDELPELVNVLRGEMSLVGPRPLLMRYLPLYSPEQARRHDVIPGITGWAQINGRNAASWPQKFALDIWYVDHQSLWLDLKIIALTFWKVIKREGISQPGRVTADFFRGETSVVRSAEGKLV